MKSIFNFAKRKVKLLLRLCVVAIIAVLWMLSLKYAGSTESFSIFFVNGEVIPMSADEHIVAKISNNNCKITNTVEKKLSKATPFLKSKGKINYVVNINFEYLINWDAFTIDKDEKRIICTFKKLELKNPVMYEIKSRETERGLFVNSKILEEQEKDFFADTGVFQTQIENQGNSERFVNLAEEKAKISLVKILKERVFPMLKIKTSTPIDVRFATSLKAEKIVDLKTVK